MKCATCGAEAVWHYTPADKYGADYCDECVPRGCSCNLKYVIEGGELEEFTDEKGRLLPCVEYDYIGGTNG